jgi:hypothetical protein
VLRWQPQHRKLQKEPWACPAKMTAQVGGQGRDVNLIPLKVVPMWLVGASVKKVKRGLDLDLLSCQLEVVEVLSAWFLGISNVPGLARESAEVKARPATSERECIEEHGDN